MDKLLEEIVALVPIVREYTFEELCELVDSTQKACLRREYYEAESYLRGVVMACVYLLQNKMLLPTAHKYLRRLWSLYKRICYKQELCFDELRCVLESFDKWLRQHHVIKR